MLVVLAFVVAACGTRVPHDEIVGAARGDAASGSTGNSSTDTGNSGTSTGGSVAVPGGVNQALPGDGSGAPATAGPGLASGNSGGGAATAGSSGGTDGASAPGASGSSGGAVQQPGASTGGGGRGPAVANGSLVQLGNMGDYAGVVGSIFGPARPAIQVWERSVNSRGGLNGHPVKVNVADTGGSPSKAMTLARNMVESTHIVAFVGNLTPLDVTGYAAYVQSKNIPVIGGDAADTTWSTNPMLFPVGADYIYSNALGAKYAMMSTGKKKIGFLYCGEIAACVQGKDAVVSTAPGFGGQMVTVKQVALTQPSYAAECSVMKSAGVEVGWIAADSTALGRVVRDCKAQGLKLTYVTTSLAGTIAAQKDPNLDGVIMTATTFPFMVTDTPTAREYQDAMRRFAPSTGQSQSSSQVWTAGKGLELASQMAPLPANVTSADILRGLWKIKNSNVYGLIPAASGGGVTYAQGRPATTPKCAFPVQISGGKYIAPTGSTRPLC